MNCSSKIVNLDATIGSTFCFQFVLKQDDGTVIDITDYRVLFAAKSVDGETLLIADSEGESPKIELDATEGALIQIDLPETLAPQEAQYNVLIVDDDGNLPVLRGKLSILSQIADPTP